MNFFSSKRVIFIFIFFLSITFPSGVSFASTWNLKEVFIAARENGESIKRAQLAIDQSLEQKTRARGAVLPTVSGIGSYTRIDPPDGNGKNPFLLTRQYVAGVRLIQPLLRGGSVAAYQLAKENILLARYQRQASELNLYELVINTFYNFALAEVDEKNLKELLRLSEERVKEIKARTLIGRSRKGELSEALAQEHVARSGYEESLMRVKEGQKELEFLTAKPVEAIYLPQEKSVPRPLVSEYLKKLETRADLLAQGQQVVAAQKQIEISRGGHLPSVDLVSNYYLDRTGILATSEWDVGVQVNIPLYQGGGVSASVREAHQGKRIQELSFHEAKRAAERDVRVLHENLQRMELQLESLKKALTQSEEAYRLALKDYRFGLVTNLDVLRTMNTFIDTKRSYERLVVVSQMTHKNLDALTGALP